MNYKHAILTEKHLQCFNYYVLCSSRAVLAVTTASFQWTDENKTRQILPGATNTNLTHTGTPLHTHYDCRWDWKLVNPQSFCNGLSARELTVGFIDRSRDVTAAFRSVGNKQWRTWDSRLLSVYTVYCTGYYVTDRSFRYASPPVVKIDCSKRLAFLLYDFKLISNQQQLISKTDTYVQSM